MGCHGLLENRTLAAFPNAKVKVDAFLSIWCEQCLQLNFPVVLPGKQ